MELLELPVLLAAAAAAMGRGLTLDEVVSGAAALAPVPGRFETVSNALGFTVVVDTVIVTPAHGLLVPSATVVTPVQPSEFFAVMI